MSIPLAAGRHKISGGLIRLRIAFDPWMLSRNGVLPDYSRRGFTVATRPIAAKPAASLRMLKWYNSDGSGRPVYAQA
jgi:hypothetical protein